MGSRDDAPGFRRLQGDVDRLFLDLLRGERVPRRGQADFRPNADVYYDHRDNAVMVKLELPGIDPDNITLEIENNVLRVSGVRTDQRPPDAVYHRMEISYGRFERAIPLPPEVDTGRASAGYEGGYLEIRLPVKERKTRLIPITPRNDEGGGEKR